MEVATSLSLGGATLPVVAEDDPETHGCPQEAVDQVCTALWERATVDPEAFQFTPSAQVTAWEMATASFHAEHPEMSVAIDVDAEVRMASRLLPPDAQRRARYATLVRGLTSHWTPGVAVLDFADARQPLRLPLGRRQCPLESLSVMVVEAYGNRPRLYARSYGIGMDNDGCIVGGADQLQWSRNLLRIPDPADGGSLDGLPDRHGHIYSQVLRILRSMLAVQEWYGFGEILEQYQRDRDSSVEEAEGAMAVVTDTRLQLSRLFYSVGRQRFHLPACGLLFSYAQLPEAILPLVCDTDIIKASDCLVPVCPESLAHVRDSIAEIADFRPLVERLGDRYHRGRMLSGVRQLTAETVQCIPVHGDCYEADVRDYSARSYLQLRPQVAVLACRKGYTPPEELQFTTPEGIVARISRDDRPIYSPRGQDCNN